MSTVISLDTHLLIQPNSLLYDNIEAILQILSNSDKENIASDWLLGTRNWEILTRGKTSEEEIGDLLEEFVHAMDKLVEEGYIKRNDDYEDAIQYVKDLQKRRYTLEMTEHRKTPTSRKKT